MTPWPFGQRTAAAVKAVSYAVRIRRWMDDNHIDLPVIGAMVIVAAMIALFIFIAIFSEASLATADAEVGTSLTLIHVRDAASGRCVEVTPGKHGSLRIAPDSACQSPR